MSVRTKDLLHDLRTIRAAVDRLERRIAGEPEQFDVIERRRALLNDIYWRGNSITREELVPILESKGTSYQWIAQQKKKGYLSVVPVPGRSARYSVTSLAVRELRLDDEREIEETEAFSALSNESFAEDWESEEDAVYDGL